VSSLRFTAAIATALFLGCFLEGCSSGPTTVKAASVKDDKDRHNAPDFALKDADGRTVHLTDYKGKVVLLDFWATWCGPCRIEIPWFTEMQRTRKDKGFEVLGVAMDDNGWEDVKPFLAQMKVNYRVVIGDDATSSAYGGVEDLPTTFLIDKQGKIAAIHIGLANRKEFENGVDELLGEGNTPVNAGNGAVPPAVAAAKQQR
jgi:cytochrome c biogenesis protein CcmG/thiol:disulfide interchange protein DsbE